MPLWQAVGLLEALWNLAARQCPQGDIGRLSNEDIAVGLEYAGDENLMVEALCGSGWLDPDENSRLIIHDWHDHADDAVHMKLARARLFFADGRTPKFGRLPTHERRAAEQFYAESTTPPDNGSPVQESLITEDVEKPDNSYGVPTNPETVHTDQENVSTACIRRAGPPRPAPPRPVIEVLSTAAKGGTTPKNFSPPIEPKPLMEPAPKTGGLKAVPKPHRSPTAEADFERERELREFARVALETYPGAQVLFGPPDEVVIGKCLALCRNRSLPENEVLAMALRSMAHAHKKPSSSWMWFPTVIEKYLGRMAS